MNNVIEATTGNGSSATPRGGERMLLLFARYWGREDLQGRTQEEAAIDAEDTLTQADEALVLG
jgi:hypothetical protein